MSKQIKLKDDLLISIDRPLYRYIGKIQPIGGDMLTLMSNHFEEICYQMQLMVQFYKHQRVSNAYIIDVETGNIISLSLKDILQNSLCEQP